MSNDKLFTVAGTATHKGVTKVRFANDLVARIKILAKAGATDVNLVELPQAMTKLQALKYLQEQGITAGDAGFAVANKLAESKCLQAAPRPSLKLLLQLFDQMQLRAPTPNPTGSQQRRQ